MKTVTVFNKIELVYEAGVKGDRTWSSAGNASKSLAYKYSSRSGSNNFGKISRIYFLSLTNPSILISYQRLLGELQEARQLRDMETVHVTNNALLNLEQYCIDSCKGADYTKFLKGIKKKGRAPWLEYRETDLTTNYKVV